jgi:hypothetical protein
MITSVVVLKDEEKTAAPLLTIYDAENKRYRQQMVEEGFSVLRFRQNLAFERLDFKTIAYC